MKLKRYFGQAVLIASLVIAFTMSVEAKTLILGRGAGKWTVALVGKKYILKSKIPKEIIYGCMERYM